MIEEALEELSEKNKDMDVLLHFLNGEDKLRKKALNMYGRWAVIDFTSWDGIKCRARWDRENGRWVAISRLAWSRGQVWKTIWERSAE